MKWSLDKNETQDHLLTLRIRLTAIEIFILQLPSRVASAIPVPSNERLSQPDLTRNQLVDQAYLTGSDPLCAWTVINQRRIGETQLPRLRERTIS
jgi:hypothetical protein